MDEVLQHYEVPIFECGEGETRMQCVCPLPDHVKKKKDKTLRIFGAPGHFTGWKCFSTKCRGNVGKGNDVVRFVALMEGCDTEAAILKLAEWFSAKLEQEEKRVEGVA